MAVFLAILKCRWHFVGSILCVHVLRGIDFLCACVCAFDRHTEPPACSIYCASRLCFDFGDTDKSNKSRLNQETRFILQYRAHLHRTCALFRRLRSAVPRLTPFSFLLPKFILVA